MATDSVRVPPRSSILDRLDRKETPRDPETASDAAGHGDGERTDPLPAPGMPYVAHARRASRPQMTLFFVGKDYLPDGFSYANLERVRLVEPEKPGTGPLLVLYFSGGAPAEVTIEGRHLHSLCHAIGMHMMPWVWEHPSPRDFAAENETVIRSIRFNFLQP